MLMVELSRHFVGPHNSIPALTIATQGSPNVDVHLTCSSSVHRLSTSILRCVSDGLSIFARVSISQASW